MESALKPARRFVSAATIVRFAILEKHYDQRPSHRKQKSNHGKYCEAAIRPVGEVESAVRPITAAAQKSSGANAVAGEGLQRVAAGTGRGGNRTVPETSAFVSAAARANWKAGRDSGDEGRVCPFLEGHLPKLLHASLVQSHS
jgi:hypothetical protein